MKNNWNELKDIKAPQELKERTLAAAREARKLTNEPLHAVPRHPWGMAKRLLAAACAFGIVLGGTAVYRTHNGTAQTGSAAVADAISHTFGFAAYAADTGELRQPKDSKIVFDTGSGADDPEKGFYSGCLFKVTGENIKTISATIDKGAVYRTKTVKDTSADRDEWVRSMHQGTNPELDGADRIMVWGSDEMHMYADLCWKLDNGFIDAYDPDTSYGLWLSSQPGTTDDDLQDSWHAAVDKPDSKRMPGWYTGYVRDIYAKKKGNIEKIEKSANHLFDKRVQYLLAHPDEASWFFSTKFISSWTEGSFQSIWNGPSKDKFQPLWNRFATSIYHDGTLHLFFVTYMQGYLLVLYLGGVFYYAFTYKRMGDVWATRW